MARPAGGYHSTVDGKRLPGTSTVAKLISDPSGLYWWHWNEGHEGREFRAALETARAAGTLVHEAAESWKHGQPYTWTGPADVVAKAKRGYAAFLEWTQQTRLKIEQTEVSLVSETHRFGGTFDCILIGERRVMCDFKTSAAVYPEHLLQVAAYGKLWEEHHPDQPITGGFYILRFSKEYGDFAANWYADLEDAWRSFLLCRQLYDLKGALGKRCR